MKILILAEHDGHQLSPNVRQTVSAAQFWNSPIHLLIAGHGTDTIAQSAASIKGVERVIHANASHLAHPLAEDLAGLIVSISEGYDVILSAHASFSRNVLPRVAALLDVAMISDVLEIKADNTYVRSIYAGNILTTIQSRDPVQVLTVHSSNFTAMDLNGNAEIISVEVP